MRHIFGNFVLIFMTFFGILTSLFAALRPSDFASRLGLAIANSGGSNEIRAQYAGFFLAISIVCIAALFGGVPRQSAFIVLIVVFAGLVSGRLVSLVLNHGTSGYPPAILTLIFFDSLGLLLSLTALSVSPA